MNSKQKSTTKRLKLDIKARGDRMIALVSVLKAFSSVSPDLMKPHLYVLSSLLQPGNNGISDSSESIVLKCTLECIANGLSVSTSDDNCSTFIMVSYIVIYIYIYASI